MEKRPNSKPLWTHTAWSVGHQGAGGAIASQTIAKNEARRTLGRSARFIDAITIQTHLAITRTSPNVRGNIVDTSRCQCRIYRTSHQQHQSRNYEGIKLLIRGPNGAGKSNILHSLRGTLPLLEGDRLEN